jgi:hypothetical protein
MTLVPAYIQGEAYLAKRNGAAAQAEFQKFILLSARTRSSNRDAPPNIAT